MAEIRIKNKTIVREHELTFLSSKSSGPGGQHVNTTNSRVTLIWNFSAASTLSLATKDRLIMLAGSKVKSDGTLRISSQNHRSQKQNQQACLVKLEELLHKALNPPKKRKPTKVPKAQKRARLDSKKKNSEKKSLRKAIKF